MAVSRSFEEFSLRMAWRASEWLELTEDRIRRTAVVLDTRLVMATPVDTGRARGNWVCSLGTPQQLLLSDSASGFPSADEATGSARQTIGGWKLSMGPIYVSNSLPYIRRLDEGWSAKAPQGMVKQALAAARQELKRKLKWKK